MIKSLGYSFKQAFIQLFRNRGMSIASIFSITAMLLILGLFCMLTVNVNVMTENVKEQFDTIEVFLLDTATVDDRQNLANSFLRMDGVLEVNFIPKEQAMEEFRERLGNNGYMLDNLLSNPLPDALRIRVASIEKGDLIAKTAESMKGPLGVEDVRYYQSEVNKVLEISNSIQKGAIVIIAFLIIVSVVVVSNTIKLTVMARQDEIMIMKYVGATNWFVRGPMLAEGMLIGFLSALIALGLSILVYMRITAIFGDQVMLLLSTRLVDPIYMLKNLAWIFTALGISIGAVGSIISMRRFLKA